MSSHHGGTKKLTQKLKKTLPVTGPQAPTLYELMQWYCLTTNTHGCRRIVVSKGRLRKWIWIILTLIAVALIFWQCALLLMSYYGVSVSITVTYQKLVFPAVTICNMNPYRYSSMKKYLGTLEAETVEALEDIYGYNKILNRRRRDTDTPLKGPDEKIFLKKIPLLRMESIIDNELIVTEIPSRKRSIMKSRVMHSGTDKKGVGNMVGYKLCDPKNSTDCTVFTFSSGVNAIQEWYRLHYMNILAEIPMEEKVAMGYSADELLVTCFFDGRSCDSRNFSLFHHPLYGNCYTFNGANREELLVSSMGGMEYGLKVVLYIDEDEYNPYLVTAAGAKIMVHDQNAYPFIEDSGTELQTGVETSIGMQLTESTKLNEPYSDCTLDGTDVGVQNLFNKKYTYQICLHSCFQLEMVRTCGCAHYDRPLPEGAKYCNYKEFPSWIYCYFKLHQKFIQEELGCQNTCRESCDFKEWTLTRSVAKWPSVNSEEWILRVLSWEMGKKLEKNLTKYDLANLDIFYHDLNLRSISESPATSIVTLLSNFGGQLGLWMSCSMVCVLEIIEIFLIDSFWVVLRQRWHKLCKWWKKRKEDQPEQTTDVPVPSMTGHDNPVCIDEEDPPTFNTALQLPQAHNCEVPRTPPPRYNTLRIRPPLSEEQIDMEYDIVERL
ncbi:amiloride-sensitive sodium channel subunit gamma [Spea bombifrons]|uniref:amiloride-sensitive sodium channel subunit gamma n=1 Tax=Spea bombifrons TaxID=233779 RepID=UPI00234A583C|nr:amiloride-sensitive sodium channel subunit gamma [Spea bombifrons]XP_053328278.1 amiloride-sensitive sodium channel subunit gamma [Spea bombifrons]